MKRMGAVLGFCAIGALATYAGVRVYKLTHYPEWHSRVAPGDSEEVVREKMDPPDAINVVPQPLWCRDAAVYEFMYGHSLPPEWWVVGFDPQRRVSCTKHLQS